LPPLRSLHVQSLACDTCVLTPVVNLAYASACRFCTSLTTRGGSLMVQSRVYPAIAPIAGPVAQIPIIPPPIPLRLMRPHCCLAGCLLFGGALVPDLVWGRAIIAAPPESNG
jgi:hypothetical protein